MAGAWWPDALRTSTCVRPCTCGCAVALWPWYLLTSDALSVWWYQLIVYLKYYFCAGRHRRLACANARPSVSAVSVSGALCLCVCLCLCVWLLVRGDLLVLAAPLRHCHTVISSFTSRSGAHTQWNEQSYNKINRVVVVVAASSHVQTINIRAISSSRNGPFII